MAGPVARGAALLVILAGLVGASGAARAETGCFWVHGRLYAANGAPTFRIWRIGTKRVLGVVGADGRGDPDLPQTLKDLILPNAFDVDVYGDYRVCPLREDHPGWMRLVRLEGARRLIARPHSAGATPNGG